MELFLGRFRAKRAHLDCLICATGRACACVCVCVCVCVSERERERWGGTRCPAVTGARRLTLAHPASALHILLFGKSEAAKSYQNSSACSPVGGLFLSCHAGRVVHIRQLWSESGTWCPAETGARRRTLAHPASALYPSTDPCAAVPRRARV